jgi:hypothetical protein
MRVVADDRAVERTEGASSTVPRASSVTRWPLAPAVLRPWQETSLLAEKKQLPATR